MRLTHLLTRLVRTDPASTPERPAVRGAGRSRRKQAALAGAGILMLVLGRRLRARLRRGRRTSGGAAETAGGGSSGDGSSPVGKFVALAVVTAGTAALRRLAKRVATGPGPHRR